MPLSSYDYGHPFITITIRNATILVENNFFLCIYLPQISPLREEEVEDHFYGAVPFWHDMLDPWQDCGDGTSIPSSIGAARGLIEIFAQLRQAGRDASFWLNAQRFQTPPRLQA